jgi:hypothetical protein
LKRGLDALLGLGVAHAFGKETNRDCNYPDHAALDATKDQI